MADVSPYARGLLICLFGVIVIAPDVLLIRLADGVHHWAQVFWRGVLGGGVLLIGGRMFGLRLFWPRGLDWAVVVAFAVGSLGFVYSTTHTSPANTLFLIAVSPVFSALIAWAFLKETVGLRTVLTIVAVLFGIALIAFGSVGAVGEGGRIAGDIAALFAALSLAVAFSIARVNKDRSLVPLTAYGWLVGALVAAGLAPTLAVPSEDWVWIIAMGAIVSPVAFACLTNGPRYLPAADVGLIMLLEAVFGPLLLWAVLGEAPGGWALLGGAVILGAMVVSNLVLLLRRR